MANPLNSQSTEDVNPENRVAPLNPIDKCMSLADQTIRNMGFAGFDTQMFAWLGGKVDVSPLESAIGKLGELHPLVTARLNRTSEDSFGHWSIDPKRKPSLNVVQLDNDCDSSVEAAAAELLSTTVSTSESDSIRFNLIRRKLKGDVLVIQYNHTILDNNMSKPLFQMLSKLVDGVEISTIANTKSRSSSLAKYVTGIRIDRRRAAAKSVLHLMAHQLRGGTISMGRSDVDPPKHFSVQLSQMQLDEKQTDTLVARATELCGFPGLSMAILASVFRGIDRYKAPQKLKRTNLVAGIGVDLPCKRESLFQNLLSLIPVHAHVDEIDDRDSLVRMLNDQMQQHIRNEIDLGTLRMALRYSRSYRHLRWVFEHVMRFNYSMWYAYFGKLDDCGTHFGGQKIMNIHYAGPTWSPLGMTILASQYNGRLHLQSTFAPHLIDHQRANRFLHFVRDDLIA